MASVGAAVGKLVGGAGGTRIYIYDDAAEKVTNTPEMRSLLLRVARASLEEAYASAPVYSGHYQNSLAAVLHTENDKPEARLSSSSSFWHFVEFGALETPPYHTMGEAVSGQVERYEETGPGGGE